MFAGVLGRLLRAAELAGVRGRVRCVICEWKGLEFRPLVGPGWMQRNARCPGCGAVQRQRLLAFAVSANRLAGRVLWVAPEECLRRTLDNSDMEVITADLSMPGVDIQADIERLPFHSGTVACLVISDVLEHVVDDQRALQEMRRVLADRGVALVHVPILTTETVEYGFANEGEWGHRRAYGPDIVRRFGDASLELSAYRADQFSRRDQRRHGLLDWDAVLVATRADGEREC
ncbi:MAG TPA: methyltransferase domain-containing protein [Acidimicrobiales bacterium]|nr:methyltransferase domain-containing protein [Acidimicrobiales bacterium]